MKCKQIIYLLSSIIVFTACSRNNSTSGGGSGPGPGGGGTPAASLSDFSAQPIERTWSKCVINWTASVSSNPGEQVKYRILVNGVIADSNLINRIDTLLNVRYENDYSIQVVAYTASGLIKTATVALQGLQGSVFHSQQNSNGLLNIKLFTDNVNSPLLWKVNSSAGYANSYCYSTPVVSGDTVFYVTGQANQGSISAHRISNGSLIWSVSTNYAIVGGRNPTYYQGNLYFSTPAGLMSIRSSNGQENWRFTTTLPLTNNPGCNPVISNGRVLAQTQSNSGYLVSIDLTNGNPVWYYNLNSVPCNTPLVYNGIIYLTVGTEVHAINETTGVRIWMKSGLFSSDFSPLLAGNNLIVSNGNGYIHSLNPVTGATIWTKDNVGAPTRTSGLAQGNGYIFYYYNDPPTGKARLRCLRVSNGDLVWDVLTFSPNLINLIYARGMVFAFDDFYGMWQFNANSGIIESGLVGSVTSYQFTQETFLVHILGTPYYNYQNGNYKPF